MADPARRPEAALRPLTELLRRGGDVDRGDPSLAAGRARFLEAIDPPAKPRRFALVWALSAIVAVLVAVVILRGLRPEAAITFQLDDTAAGRESYVRAGPAGATARFSEGTTVAFAPGTRGRIAAVTARGARVSLETGSAHFRVTHRPGAEWVAEVGPFTVNVIGTEFDLRWHHDRLELTLQEGTVVLRGPLASEGIAVHGGQRVVADVAAGQLVLTASAPSGDRSAAPSAAAPGTASDLPAAPAISAKAPPRASAAPAAASAAASAGYRERVARGDFRGVVEDAEARGVDGMLASSPLSELAALADAARYAGRGDLAERALRAERSRFAGSAEARSAAFLLGRMAETSAPAAAITWYDLYLSESPGGSLAAEALGRKMLVLKRSSGDAAARPTAEEYTRRYPQGAFAATAAEILGAR